MKFCKDCKWFRLHPDEQTDAGKIEYAQCTNPLLNDPPPPLNPVSGEPVEQSFHFCETERQDFGAGILGWVFPCGCGPRGRFWEPRT